MIKKVRVPLVVYHNVDDLFPEVAGHIKEHPTVFHGKRECGPVVEFTDEQLATIRKRRRQAVVTLNKRSAEGKAPGRAGLQVYKFMRDIKKKSKTAMTGRQEGQFIAAAAPAQSVNIEVARQLASLVLDSVQDTLAKDTLRRIVSLLGGKENGNGDLTGS